MQIVYDPQVLYRNIYHVKTIRITQKWLVANKVPKSINKYFIKW